ncbi:hypothetical protein AMS68_006821 [Peltaster fructicola]|uniref:Uncharacterized protein n=1 Tax=Peltaster fructicola TaxID=286661 RepID=A0A6H0Y2R9_9PEZI|nr:hypothetical protein AMS68_006821 [Peltaster fructicola]
MPKFSIDIPRLMSTKKVERPSKDRRLMLVDSPPPTPKSVRPPLPIDVEAALRAVCTQIFNDSTNAPLPGVDHDLITSFWRHADAAADAVPYRQPETQAKSISTEPPNVLKQDVSSPAVLRVDRVMASTTEPTHWRSRSSTSGQLTATLPRNMQRRRPLPGGRGDSIDTTYSGAQSDATDDHNGSTALTSAVITPLKGSKRTSAHGLPALPDLDPTVFNKAKQWQSPDAPAWPKLRSPAFTTFQSTTLTNHNTPTEPPMNSTSSPQPPPQRPYHQAHSPATESTTVPASEGQSAQSERAAMVEAQTERSGRTTFRDRAASRARSLSRGLREYLRPSSRRAQHEENEPTHEPAQGWVQNATNRIKDLTRPGTSDRNINMNLSKRGRRLSRESFTFRRRTSVDQHGNYSHADVLGPPQRTLHSAVKHTRASQSIEALVATGTIDLNRELPPLPAIGTWEGDGPGDHVEAEPTSLVSPIVLAKGLETTKTVVLEMRPPLDGPSSPCLIMSATAFPGDFEYYEPLDTQSPISESSIKEFRTNTALSRRSIHSVAISTFEGEDDDDDIALESPKVAKLLNRLSEPDVRPQLVHNRRPSGSSKATSRASSRRISREAAEHIREMPAMPRAIPADVPPKPQPDEDSPASDEYNTAPERHSVGSTTTQTVILLPSKTKSRWWKAGKGNRKSDWMANVEHNRSCSGTILIDDCASSPVIRYS